MSVRATGSPRKRPPKSGVRVASRGPVFVAVTPRIVDSCACYTVRERARETDRHAGVVPLPKRRCARSKLRSRLASLSPPFRRLLLFPLHGEGSSTSCTRSWCLQKLFSCFDIASRRVVIGVMKRRESSPGIGKFVRTLIPDR